MSEFVCIDCDGEGCETCDSLVTQWECRECGYYNVDRAEQCGRCFHYRESAWWP